MSIAGKVLKSVAGRTPVPQGQFRERGQSRGLLRIDGATRDEPVKTPSGISKRRQKQASIGGPKRNWDSEPQPRPDAQPLDETLHL